MPQTIIILHNIRSAHNVGSIFRTADAAGASKIILSGYTPAPIDRFGRERKELNKVALGAEKTIEWKQTKQLSLALKKLKQEGYTIVAIEQSQKSTPLFGFKPKPNQKLAIILGNEVRGLSPQVLKYADTLLEIPMRGKKESLNVGVAAGIVLFGILTTK
ncbi:MAG: TrmH family RNA methyltransferase [Patescibacteria group bacterium]|nr:TrmH family RNA methyltransferase [Patescibacteria group bacterium]